MLPFRRTASAPHAPSHPAKPLMATPLSAIQLVNLCAEPDLYMARDSDDWLNLSARDVIRTRAHAATRDRGARIRDAIRHNVHELDAPLVQALHDKAAYMAINKG